MKSFKVFSVFWFTLCAVKFSSQQITSSNPNDVRFIFYPSEHKPIEIKYGNIESLKQSGLLDKAPTILLIDGFYSNGKSSMNRNMKNAFLSLQERVNVIVVDWGELSSSRLTLMTMFHILTAYLGVVGNVPTVGKRIAEFLNFLKVHKGIQFQDVHIVGHSLGAHIAGTAGKTVISKYHGQIGRISGLDPAGPSFSRFSLAGLNDEKLLKGDASFVDIYYTNQGVLGDFEMNVGDMNVFINGGNNQPGCEKFDSNLDNATRTNSWIANAKIPVPERLKGYCNHTYSWRIFYYSILTRGFPACPCVGEKCKCTSCGNERCNSPVMAGLPAAARSRGDYYVHCKDPLIVKN